MDRKTEARLRYVRSLLAEARYQLDAVLLSKLDEGEHDLPTGECKSTKDIVQAARDDTFEHEMALNAALGEDA